MPVPKVKAAEPSIATGENDTFARVVRNAPFGIYIVDSDFRVLEISAGCKKVFEQLGPVVGRDFSEILKLIWEEPFASECIGHFRRTLETGEAYRAADTSKPRGNVPDDESYDWKLERIALPDGTYGVVCYFYDLTERIQMADALREADTQLRGTMAKLSASEQFSRTMLENSPDCVKIMDESGRLEYVNATGVTLLEHDNAAALIGEFWWTFWPEDKHERIKDMVRKAAAGEPSRFQVLRPTAKGTPKWWDIIVSSVPVTEGESPRLISVLRDITEAKRSEQIIRESRDELEIKIAERTAELEEAHRVLTRSLTELVSVQESERMRISRDVHDQVGGTLTGLRMNLESLSANTVGNDDVQKRIENIQKIAKQLDSDISYIAWMLRPTILDDLGLVPALEAFVADWSVRFSVPATFKAIGVSSVQLGRDIETNLYRIVQEALTNIAKHAQATSASVILRQGERAVSLVVEDNGKGIDRTERNAIRSHGEPKHGLGLGGMRDRARLIGASSFEIETSDAGTTILVTVPTEAA